MKNAGGTSGPHGHWALDALYGADAGPTCGRRREETIAARKADKEFVGMAILAHDIAAMEYLEDGNKSAAKEVCSRLYALRRAGTAPGWSQPARPISEVLQMAAIGVCAGRLEEVRAWQAQADWTRGDGAAATWERQLLDGLLAVWKAILSGRTEEVQAVLPTTKGLRKLQRTREKRMIEGTAKKQQQSLAWRLAGLYHALHASKRAAESIQGEADAAENAAFHFDMASKGFEWSGGETAMLHAHTMRWLKAAAGALA